ncbi:signal peptidase II [Paenibacillus selenitireducens]|uniref:Lipoprotein signal peptidase n=1 Tax=Paenibacillus selenitireducens TaxID=1324314 RepID=A0A1T2XF98_9BACL|nr:signal peptidase II [Paenibacillus selenitireducens]OPA78482.1 signal peptidase II [Paenibacillus selenitireducens]
MIYFLIGLIVIILDQVTKWMIATKLMIGEEISVIGNFFLITSHRNRGAAFGILQEQRWFFVVITIVVVSAIIWYMLHIRKSASWVILTGLGLILGGAIGNFWDRALHGEVVDFLMFNFGSYTFPIFNVADSAICVGVVLVLLDSLFMTKKESEHHVQSEEQQ